MNRKIIAVLLLAVMSMSFVLAETSTTETAPRTLSEKFSYVLGIYFSVNSGAGNAMHYLQVYKQYYFPEIDLAYGLSGIDDYNKGTSLYTLDEMNKILSDYPADYSARQAEIAEKNLKTAEAFLAENKTKSGIITTDSGLQYRIIKQGTGEKAQPDAGVELDYELTLLDGTVIDSSYARGEHSTFPLSSVIAGFKEGVMLMPMGSHYIFYIHPALGYGANAAGGMEPNSLLVFNVETYSIAK
ncbi:MAG: FKBP-type peptidyl-prolyl cis-trans isomerase [Spirochaetales bacterium]